MQHNKHSELWLYEVLEANIFKNNTMGFYIFNYIVYFLIIYHKIAFSAKMLKKKNGK